MRTYGANEKPEDLSLEQLELLTRCDHFWLIDYFKQKTVFDADRIRVLLELGQAKAKELLETNYTKEG